MAKTQATTLEKKQTANQRSKLMCEDLAYQPITLCGTVNRSPSDRRRVQWPDQGRSAHPCRPVVSLRFPSFLLVSLRFSGVPHQICVICVEHRLWAAAVLKSRLHASRNVSETCTTTREGLFFTDLETSSRKVRTKSLVSGQPGHHRLDQCSDSVIISQILPSTWPHM